MHVVYVYFLRVGVEGRVDVLVDVGEHMRLLHGDHVVAVEGFGRIRAAQLFVEREQLVRGLQLLFLHFVDVRAMRALEGEPHG